MKKQTAVEWLIEQFQLHGYLGLYIEEEHIEKHKVIFESIMGQAKAMHKEEIINAVNACGYIGGATNDEAEEYYIENYEN